MNVVPIRIHRQFGSPAVWRGNKWSEGCNHAHCASADQSPHNLLRPNVTHGHLMADWVTSLCQGSRNVINRHEWRFWFTCLHCVQVLPSATAALYSCDFLCLRHTHTHVSSSSNQQEGETVARLLHTAIVIQSQSSSSTSWFICFFLPFKIIHMVLKKDTEIFIFNCVRYCFHVCVQELWEWRMRTQTQHRRQGDGFQRFNKKYPRLQRVKAGRGQNQGLSLWKSKTLKIKMKSKKENSPQIEKFKNDGNNTLKSQYFTTVKEQNVINA